MTFSSFFKTLSMLVCGFVAMALVAMPANAATIDLSPLSALAGEVDRVLADVIAAVLVGAVAWAGRKWFSLTIDAKQRESLHGAIERGIGSALDVMAKKVDGKTAFEVNSEIVALVANYVIKMSPDAVKYFGVTPDKLADLIKAKFGELLLTDADFEAGEAA